MGPVEIKGVILGMAVVAGAFCLWLGYRLYDKGVLEKGRVAAQGQGMKVTVKDYGPGVVFALFGAAVIVFALTRTLTSSQSETTTRYAPASAGEKVAASGGPVNPKVPAAGGQSSPSPEDGVVLKETTSTTAAEAASVSPGTAPSAASTAIYPEKH